MVLDRDSSASQPLEKASEDALNYEDYAQEDPEDSAIDEYDLTSTPNDFNVLTIFNFIESGAIVIPGFQRNYVWDIKHASKLIESLILGLPVPQIFLYEEARNRFLVIDGQQRLMSIYFFMKQRFPHKEKRSQLRKVFSETRTIPDELLHNDEYFRKFNLVLPSKLPNTPSRFADLNYSTLGDYRTQFDLRPIRNVIVKQNSPANDHSSIYEIFNRLNSGGMNLTPQEIRISLYHSRFFETLHTANLESGWRRLLNLSEPDLHMKDVEILLRGFAMLMDGDEYAPSMVKFLNRFSERSKKRSEEESGYLLDLFRSFLRASEKLPDETFLNRRTKRFNIALFEAVFAVVCSSPFRERGLVKAALDEERVQRLQADPEFQKAALVGTTQTANVKKRLERAQAILF